jgi:pyruvate dehydrogenase E2 component (dihydrolipoamide acetyltransferase)
MMRQTIAKRLHAAKNDAPHFYLNRSCNMAEVIAWRARLNKDESKAKVSVNDIVMMATARALREHPECNASWQGESIREFADVHMADGRIAAAGTFEEVRAQVPDFDRQAVLMGL